jgi:hypothetical protein
VTLRSCDASIVEKPRANVSCTICMVRTCSRESVLWRRKSYGFGSLRRRRLFFAPALLVVGHEAS